MNHFISSVINLIATLLSKSSLSSLQEVPWNSVSLKKFYLSIKADVVDLIKKMGLIIIFSSLMSFSLIRLFLRLEDYLTTTTYGDVLILALHFMIIICGVLFFVIQSRHSRFQKNREDLWLQQTEPPSRQGSPSQNIEALISAFIKGVYEGMESSNNSVTQNKETPPQE